MFSELRDCVYKGFQKPGGHFGSRSKRRNHYCRWNEIRERVKGVAYNSTVKINKFTSSVKNIPNEGREMECFKFPSIVE